MVKPTMARTLAFVRMRCVLNRISVFPLLAFCCGLIRIYVSRYIVCQRPLSLKENSRNSAFLQFAMRVAMSEERA